MFYICERELVLGFWFGKYGTTVECGPSRVFILRTYIYDKYKELINTVNKVYLFYIINNDFFGGPPLKSWT